MAWGRWRFGKGGSRVALARGAGTGAIAVALLAIGLMFGVPGPLNAPAEGEATSRALPPPPADGLMGFVVASFASPMVPGTDACPEGPALRLSGMYLASLPPAERERLMRKENEKEFERRWKASAFGPNDTNVCSQPDMFQRPLLRTVQSPLAWGLDLDGDKGKGAAGADGCAQQDFTSPTGEKGIDNQEYRALGCTLEWRGKDGMPSDISLGSKQFHTSGEWTQVILLKGVDSLDRDDDVEVIYGNTADRPFVDTMGNFLHGATFSIREDGARRRNALRGRIRDGVLTTEPADIKLAQTWGQGGAREIRGTRTIFDFRKGRLRLEFQPDGSLRGMLGGYKPVFDTITAPALGGVGSALVAGMDCAAYLTTVRRFADGLRNPKTGQCEGISTAQRIMAVPAFVNDVSARQRTAAR